MVIRAKIAPVRRKTNGLFGGRGDGGLKGKFSAIKIESGKGTARLLGMNQTRLIALLLPLLAVNLSKANGLDHDVLPDGLKLTHQSLGEMGLSIDRAGNRVIEGRLCVAVPRSAVIEDEGKNYVVVLNERNPALSERLEVQLGHQNAEFIQVWNAVFPGDYIVIRADEKPTPRMARNSASKQSSFSKNQSKSVNVSLTRQGGAVESAGYRDERFYIAPEDKTEICKTCGIVHERKDSNLSDKREAVYEAYGFEKPAPVCEACQAGRTSAGLVKSDSAGYYTGVPSLTGR